MTWAWDVTCDYCSVGCSFAQSTANCPVNQVNGIVALHVVHTLSLSHTSISIRHVSSAVPLTTYCRVCVCVCVCVCNHFFKQNISKSYKRILMKCVESAGCCPKERSRLDFGVDHDQYPDDPGLLRPHQEPHREMFLLSSAADKSLSLSLCLPTSLSVCLSRAFLV